MMIIWVVVVALAALLVADPMNDYKESAPQGSFHRFNEQRSGAFETFTRNFLRRVDADGDLAGGVWPPEYHGSRPPFLFQWSLIQIDDEWFRERLLEFLFGGDAVLLEPRSGRR